MKVSGFHHKLGNMFSRILEHITDFKVEDKAFDMILVWIARGRDVGRSRM